MGCVQLSGDTDSNTGCSKCQSDSLLGRNTYDYYQVFSFNQEFTNEICRFKSDDGLSTVYCSQKDNGNRPLVVTTCYVGAFSAETPLKPTVSKNVSIELVCLFKQKYSDKSCSDGLEIQRPKVF